jgi:cyclopropane fatty-acyl-phospholipid synthase-like methyltransferase
MSTEPKPWWKIYTPRNVYLESVYRLGLLRRDFHFPVRKKADGMDAYDEAHAHRVGNFYDAYHDQFLHVYGSVIQAFRTKDVRHLLEYQMASMGLRAGQKVLDAGCGVGVPAIHFATYAGVSVDAITISRRQYEAAQKNVAAEGLSDRVRVIRGDYHRLPEYFDAESYDVVYFLESFGHSRAKKYLLDVCWTILKPGGLLYIKDLFKPVPLTRSHKKKLPRKRARSTKLINTTSPI